MDTANTRWEAGEERWSCRERIERVVKRIKGRVRERVRDKETKKDRETKRQRKTERQKELEKESQRARALEIKIQKHENKEHL